MFALVLVLGCILQEDVLLVKLSLAKAEIGIEVPIAVGH